MKIYATDYDGTVTYRGVTPELKEAVRRWREAGNLFGIVTGRPRNSIRSALRANGLEVDFAVSDNGATASDGSWELIYNATLDPTDIAVASHRLRELGCTLYRVSNLNAYYLSYSVPENVYAVPGTGELRIDDSQLGNINGFCGGFDDPELLEFSRTEVERATEGRIHGMAPGSRTMDFFRRDVSKAAGLKRYVKLSGASPEKIYTTGDAPNDLPMLTDPDFEGYCVDNAMEKVKSEVGRSVDSPLELLRRFI